MCRCPCREDSNPLLLPNQVGGLGLWCPKFVCPQFLPSGSICNLHFWNQQKKLHNIQCQLHQFTQFQLESISSLVCRRMKKFCAMQKKFLPYFSTIFKKSRNLFKKFFDYSNCSKKMSGGLQNFCARNFPKTFPKVFEDLGIILRKFLDFQKLFRSNEKTYIMQGHLK